MEPYFGLEYKLEYSENFDDLMVFLGHNFIERKIGCKMKPVQSATDNGDGTYSIHFWSILTNFELVFTPGVEFVETKPDRVKVKALLTIEGNKIHHRQREDNGRTLNHVYEFGPETMIITTTAKGMDKVVKRHFKLVKK